MIRFIKDLFARKPKPKRVLEKIEVVKKPRKRTTKK